MEFVSLPNEKTLNKEKEWDFYILLYNFYSQVIFSVEIMKIPMQTFMYVYTCVFLRTKHPFCFSVTMLTISYNLPTAWVNLMLKGILQAALKTEALHVKSKS